MPLRTTSLAALLALSLAAPLHAQEMQALRDEVGDGAPMSYIGTRCAAFFISSAATLGDQIDEAMQEQVNNIVALLLMTAVNAMVETEGMDREAARDAATEEAMALTEAYRARFEANMEAGNAAFAEDPMYMADNEDCLAVLVGEPEPAATE